MQELLPRAEKVGRLLKERGETIVVAESSTGGLISAALLALPGASAYFLGGAVVYTQVARRVLVDLPDIAALGMRASTEPYARLLAQTARQRFGATWALAESGATVRPATATAMPPAIAASRSWARANAPSRWRPAAPTASPTCGRSPSPRSICCSRFLWRVSSPLGEIDAQPCNTTGLLPPPLWGRVGEGGSCCCSNGINQLSPPPLTPPHKGEGNTPNLLLR